MGTAAKTKPFGGLLLGLTLAVARLAVAVSLIGFFSETLYRERPAWLVQCRGRTSPT